LDPVSGFDDGKELEFPVKDKVRVNVTVVSMACTASLT
jgi:hypothetical protein